MTIAQYLPQWLRNRLQKPPPQQLRTKPHPVPALGIPRECRTFP
jgi:hypothetical protein